MGDGQRVLGGGDTLAHHVDHGDVQVAVGEHDPVVEVAAGAGFRVGGLVVDAELGPLDGWGRGPHRLLELVHHLALGRLDLGQAGHRGEVVERHPEVHGEGHDDRVVVVVEVPCIGVTEEQGAGASPTAPAPGRRGSWRSVTRPGHCATAPAGGCRRPAPGPP